MSAPPHNLPWIGYGLVFLCLLSFLIWRHQSLRALERDVRNAQPGEMDFRTAFSADAPHVLAADRLRAAQPKARFAYKIGLLLVVVLPVCAWFPLRLAQYEPGKQGGPKVVNARTMTRDDIDLGFGAVSGDADPVTRLYTQNLGVAAVALGILGIFPLMNPGGFGGVRTWLLWSTALLASFSATSLVYPLKSKYGDLKPAGVRLGAGAALYIVLASVFL